MKAVWKYNKKTWLAGGIDRLHLLGIMDIRDKRIIPFFNDYKLNIISVAEIADGDFDKFNTVLGKALKQEAPFFDPANQAYVLKSVKELREGKGTVHDLIEGDDE